MKNLGKKLWEAKPRGPQIEKSVSKITFKFGLWKFFPPNFELSTSSNTLCSTNPKRYIAPLVIKNIPAGAMVQWLAPTSLFRCTCGETYYLDSFCNLFPFHFVTLYLWRGKKYEPSETMFCFSDCIPTLKIPNLNYVFEYHAFLQPLSCHDRSRHCLQLHCVCVELPDQTMSSKSKNGMIH